MSNLSTVVNGATVPAFALRSRIVLPSVISRADAAKLSRELWGNVASVFADKSPEAAADAQALRLCSLAISGIVHGDSSRVDQAAKYACTLMKNGKPLAYKVDNGGNRTWTNRFAVMFQQFGETVALAKALRDTVDASSDTVDLAHLLGNSPIFGELTALPKPKAVESTAVSTPDRLPQAAENRTEETKSAAGGLTQNQLQANREKALRVHAENAEKARIVDEAAQIAAAVNTSGAAILRERDALVCRVAELIAERDALVCRVAELIAAQVVADDAAQVDKPRKVNKPRKVVAVG